MAFFAQPIRVASMLLLVGVLLYVPGQCGLPVTDRDEARFMQATRQMIESDDYVVVRFQNELRAKKPAGVYWLQAAAVKSFGAAATTTTWPFRLPSLLAAIAAVLLCFRIAASLFDVPVGFTAALVLATSLLIGIEAHLATTDAMLLAVTTAAQGCLALVYRQIRVSEPVPGLVVLGFWIALAASFMIKGPITLAIALLTVLALCIADRSYRWVRQLRPLYGVALVVLLVGPWVWAVSHATHGEFLARAWHEDLLPKLAGGHEGHGAPPGFHLAAMFLTFWPASLFAWPALWHAWRARHRWHLRFLLAWLVPAWLMFELVPTKLFHYTLPLQPALAMLVAVVLTETTQAREVFTAVSTRVVFAVWLLVTLVLGAGVLWIAHSYGAGWSGWALCAAACTLAAAVLVIACIGARIQMRHALTALLVLGGGFQTALIAGVAPSLDALWISQRAVDTLRQVAPRATVIAVGYQEPSLVFLGGTDTQLLNATQAAMHTAQSPRAAVLVEQSQLASYLAALPGSVHVMERGVIEGFNYSRGKSVRLHLLLRASGSTARAGCADNNVRDSREIVSIESRVPHRVLAPRCTVQARVSGSAS